jgi:RNA-directed DNA polymerase
MQSKGNPIMQTGMERIAAKARSNANLKFTSLAHHITKELLWESLSHINNSSARGIDEVDVKEARESFDTWADEVISRIHRKSYAPPPVRRVWIPKPGKNEKRPIGVPTVIDRTVQRTVANILSSIYEQDFQNCSFGGRPGRGAHNALVTLDRIISSRKVSRVFEADLKNYFGSLSHEWVMKFMEHRIGDPRILKLIKRWLKAGVIENGQFTDTEIGTPQGGSISVLISNVYLHYVLDLWFEKVIKPKLKGEAFLVRYIDDFVVCFQFNADAILFQEVLKKRLAKFELNLEPNKTRLIEFGRFAQIDAIKRGKKASTLYFLGFTHYCTRNLKGNFMVGRRTEKTRLKRSLVKLRELMNDNMHLSLKEQIKRINQVLTGHYNYYGIAGNTSSIAKVYRFVQRYWKTVLGKRCWKGTLSWERYSQLLKLFPIKRPKLKITYANWNQYAML